MYDGDDEPISTTSASADTDAPPIKRALIGQCRKSENCGWMGSMSIMS